MFEAGETPEIPLNANEITQFILNLARSWD